MPMPTVTTLVVDDEDAARQGLLDLLHGEEGVEVVGAYATGEEAVDAIRRLRPDLVFLDVQMPGIDGFEVLRRLQGGRLPHVVFVTAYDRYALHAFDVHAVDYLLKPFSNRRLREAVAQARQRVLKERNLERLGEQLTALLDRIEAVPRAEEPDYLARIAVKERGRVTLVDAERVDWFEAANNYVTLHVGPRTHLVRITLSELEERLDPQRFLRVHRSHIVNVERVRELRPLSSGDCVLVLETGAEVVSSRTYSEDRRRILGHLG